MASESVVGRSDDDDREVAKWKRRLDENKYIRANLLDQANMLSYTMQRLSARHRGLGVVDVYSIWWEVMLKPQAMSLKVEEKKVQVAILQQKAKATHEKSAASAAKVVAEATAVVAEPTMEERRQEHLKHQEQERDAAFRERVDALYSQQPVQLLKSLRPIEVAPLPVPVAETEWRKKECMAWERVAVSPKRQEEATPHVNMTRIRQLMTMDDDVEDASMDALVSFAQRAKPKPASLKFYCPEV
ncbi:hypothetical protein DYB28_003319 [Aphanomyces astaci]|uniref:Uncharacterized protein n=1 Tax=Aphanomyces astaci TaxID=112090 RepID=A0A397BEJ1_APHAT|nr:hypothetical protein DYB25_000272 [Aphanomyces astaci]RHY17725.1 hypothetical protein DYB36_005594 [Aphanomyces astaci]RHY46617.1 hypothetical protein DYB30_001330 [Aphanomyces astaci]RHY59638.1 hypothetical protein DYB38_006901 [Aphanomyces astaci]RHY60835.1 hypothetical protein DYB34_004444 [Aphanomyces astaci]